MHTSRSATVWLRDMDAIERHVTLPVDLEEAWDLLTRPDDLAGVAGRARSCSTPPREPPGRVVDHDGTRAAAGGRRRSSRADAWRGTGGPRTHRRRRSRVEITRRPGRAGHRGARGGGAGCGATAGRGAGPGPARPGRTACCTSRRCSWSPPPSGGERGRRRRGPRRGAVFEALADPTRRAVLRDVAPSGPRTATELAAELPISRQAVAKHLAVLREAGLVAHERGRPRGAVHRHAGPARRGRGGGSTAPAGPGTTAWPGLDGEPSPARRPSTAEPSRPPPAAVARHRRRRSPTVGCLDVRGARAGVPRGAHRRDLRDAAGGRRASASRRRSCCSSPSASLGAWLAKMAGIGVLDRLQRTVRAGRVPSAELVDGALVLFAGALMITPGFLSDCLAILLLLPPVPCGRPRRRAAPHPRSRAGCSR